MTVGYWHHEDPVIRSKRFARVEVDWRQALGIAHARAGTFTPLSPDGDAGVPCSAVLDTRELHSDPHLVARDFVKTVEHPVHGEVPLLGFAPIFSASDVPIQAAPLLGEHTEEVLFAELNLTSEEIKGLRTAGVLG